MIRDSNIPLFLWIATALCVHVFSGGGAEQGMRAVEETREIQRFASNVYEKFVRPPESFEVTLLDESEVPQVGAEPEQAEAETVEENPDLEQPRPEPSAPKPAEPPKPKEEPKKDEPKPADPPKPKEEQVEPVVDHKRRIAVKQHVKDENQKDNPEAEFIGDQANHVPEQTQARITATDQNDENPTPGGTYAGPDETPGNAEETAIAQSEERLGEPQNKPEKARDPSEIPEVDPRRAPSTAPDEPMVAWIAPEPKSEQASAAPEGKEQKAASTADPGERAREAVVAAPELLSSDQGVDRVLPSRPSEPGRKTRPKRIEQKAASLKRDPTGWLGLGKTGTTAGGMNLNLSPAAALDTIGKKQLDTERTRDTERRLTAHRGSWKPMGLERWRSAIENYVPSVKPGNQTALNTARRPFASYLNQIHNQLHPHFAFQFLPSLDRFPGSHALNRFDMHAALEIVVSGQDGRLVRMGVTKTSGVTAFDIGALESVQRASPFGAPPREILSPDGNAYLHWEFYREPNYACSTYFARPYILKIAPKPAPAPTFEPPPLRPVEEQSPADQPDRHGRSAPASRTRVTLR